MDIDGEEWMVVDECEDEPAISEKKTLSKQIKQDKKSLSKPAAAPSKAVVKDQRQTEAIGNGNAKSLVTEAVKQKSGAATSNKNVKKTCSPAVSKQPVTPISKMTHSDWNLKPIRPEGVPSHHKDITRIELEGIVFKGSQESTLMRKKRLQQLLLQTAVELLKDSKSGVYIGISAQRNNSMKEETIDNQDDDVEIKKITQVAEFLRKKMIEEKIPIVKKAEKPLDKGTDLVKGEDMKNISADGAIDEKSCSNTADINKESTDEIVAITGKQTETNDKETAIPDKQKEAMTSDKQNDTNDETRKRHLKSEVSEEEAPAKRILRNRPNTQSNEKIASPSKKQTAVDDEIGVDTAEEIPIAKTLQSKIGEVTGLESCKSNTVAVAEEGKSEDKLTTAESMEILEPIVCADKDQERSESGAKEEETSNTIDKPPETSSEFKKEPAVLGGSEESEVAECVKEDVKSIAVTDMKKEQDVLSGSSATDEQKMGIDQKFNSVADTKDQKLKSVVVASSNLPDEKVNLRTVSAPVYETVKDALTDLLTLMTPENKLIAYKTTVETMKKFPLFAKLTEGLSKMNAQKRVRIIMEMLKKNNRTLTKEEIFQLKNLIYGKRTYITTTSTQCNLLPQTSEQKEPTKPQVSVNDPVKSDTNVPEKRKNSNEDEPPKKIAKQEQTTSLPKDASVTNEEPGASKDVVSQEDKLRNMVRDLLVEQLKAVAAEGKTESSLMTLDKEGILGAIASIFKDVEKVKPADK